MKKLLESISQTLGLTKTEILTFIFVLSVFVLGLILNYTKIEFSEKKIKKFEYSFQDSLFKALSEKFNEQSFANKKKEKRVDSEVELSDFSRKELDSKKKTSQPEEHSININTADEKTLIKVPGIGRTLGKRIVELRIRKGGYRNLDELLEVSRIGLKKLNSIKKYIYIEK